MSLPKLMQFASLLKTIASGSFRKSAWLGVLQQKNLTHEPKSQKFPDSTFTYTPRDAILYALGVGVSTGEDDGLKFLYENHDDFCVLPSYAVVPALNSIDDLVMTGNMGGLEFNPAMLLHGEQYLEIYKPLSAEGATLVSSVHIADILDKKSGAVVLCNVDTRESSGAKVAFNQISLFIRGAGGFGGKKTTEKLVPGGGLTPDRLPNYTVTQKTRIDQAALYRLSGDRNPLHIDPSFAAFGGFDRPILHGLCSFGFTVRHVLKQYCNNDVSKFKAIKVRFSNPVFPGETLRTDMWTESKNRICFRTTVVETGKPCLTNGYVELRL